MSTTEKPQGGRPRGRPKTPAATLKLRGSWLVSAKKKRRRPAEAGLYESLPDDLREELTPVHIEQLYTGSGGTPGAGFGLREVVTMLDESHGETSYPPAVLSMMKAAWERWRGPLLESYCRKRLLDPSWPASLCPWAWWRFEHNEDLGGGESERRLFKRKGLLGTVRKLYEPLFRELPDPNVGRRWLDAHLRGDGPEGFAL